MFEDGALHNSGRDSRLVFGVPNPFSYPVLPPVLFNTLEWFPLEDHGHG